MHQRLISRRNFCRNGVVAAATLGMAAKSGGLAFAAEIGASATGFKIEEIERTTCRLPFRPTPRRAMDRELPHWRYTDIVEVRLANGHTGFGESMLYYTWGATNAEDVQRALGKNAVDLMWDDSFGAGLQIAMQDAVARSAGVPLHRLLGPQVHERTPLSWWNIDMPPADLAAECREAMQQGYTSYKTKGRPWFDLWAQVEAVSKAVPESFKLDMDFNDTLLDADRAIPILKELEANPRIDIYETPIPQGDVEGNCRIHEATSVKLALHYGSPPPRVVVEKNVCDGFVVGGGASNVMRQGLFCDQVKMPFWLQLVGTDITAAYSLHFGGVLKQALWPAVNCHQLFDAPLLTQPIVVKDGMSDVPTGPGLGFELNRETMKKFQVEQPQERPDPDRLLEIKWPNGRRMFVANTGVVNILLAAAKTEGFPYYKRGVMTQRVPNDGSLAWKRRVERAKQAPFFD